MKSKRHLKIIVNNDKITKPVSKVIKELRAAGYNGIEILQMLGGHKNGKKI